MRGQNTADGGKAQAEQAMPDPSERLGARQGDAATHVADARVVVRRGPVRPTTGRSRRCNAVTMPPPIVTLPGIPGAPGITTPVPIIGEVAVGSGGAGGGMAAVRAGRYARGGCRGPPW